MRRREPSAIVIIVPATKHKSSCGAAGNPATSSTSSSAQRFCGIQTIPDFTMSATEFRRANLVLGLFLDPRTGVYSCTMIPIRRSS